MNRIIEAVDRIFRKRSAGVPGTVFGGRGGGACGGVFAAWLLLGACLCAPGEDRAVINDPDGYTNVRAAPKPSAPVIAKVLRSEVFSFEPDQEAEWVKVTLDSGKTGWMHRSRIRLYFDEKDLPTQSSGEDEDELSHYGRGRGIDYSAVARAAARGEPEALKTFFSLTDVDGAAAEMHFPILLAVFHMAGDEKFSEFLRKQSLDYQLEVRKQVAESYPYPFDPIAYLRSNFPKTVEILFRREIVDWVSPDGVYAVRKRFSDEYDLTDSEVVRAEIVERSTGKTITDLTDEDAGVGSYREGKILWSPDSKRLAFFSGKWEKGETLVYQLTGAEFAKIELTVEAKDQENDPELKGAKHLHEVIRPERWLEANVLLLTRRDYFESVDSTGQIHAFGRFYEITVEIGGGATARVKRMTREH